ncbi:MAG: ABC transporter ATP-binding protein [Paracoccaceae bacterium]|nr:ABC transporter ATP-binding protein [Paracoccaceae bacterium]MDG2258779.1 ABC transporter ATP-binding protein [Paracoccaceae bacterium]
MTDPLLSVKDLRVWFQQDGEITNAVRGVSFDVHRGETVALVGESGSGKSVTALSSVQLLGDSANVAGSVMYDGSEMIGAPERELRRVRGNDVSFIFQEPMTSLNPLHTIEKQLREILELHQGARGPDIQNRIVELLERVGMPDAEIRLASYPHQLSGGQRQRVMIAMALANGPRLLVADEPTTALDVTIQAQILELLQDIKDDDGMSLLFITHDLAIVRKIADRVCVMKDGEIVEFGPTADIFAHPKHPYTKKLLSAEAGGQPVDADQNAEIVAEVQDLRIWFPIQRGLLKRTVGHIKAVNNASFSLRVGETIGIVGESGSGKTTLAMALTRLIHSRGRIVVLGREISNLSQRQMRPLRKEMQIVFQDPFGSLSPRMTVAEIIAEGLEVHGKAETESQRDLVAIMMEEVGLDPDLMDRYPHEFSGGQRQRVAIARAMILKPKLVILDEPTSALDTTVQMQIIVLLKDLQLKYGLAYLFISHDIKVVRALAHRVIVMLNGDVVEEGITKEVVDNPQSEYAKTLMASANS